ncbi:5'-methylthioadenosine phosphorylase II [sediment metagenome]|uniref:5'-methylthioadenosine phosphorylase II n=1 Tax=sediment metagenome TaxID=749907 RepID=D9PI70_9ZZZZ
MAAEVSRAVIGGTGFSELASDFQNIETDYGTIKVGHIELGGKEVLFVPRHIGLEIPQLVNYRGNIQALKLLGVNTVFAVSAAGRLAQNILPGHLVAVSNVDHEGSARTSSFADTPGLLLHASPEDICSPGLRDILIQSWGAVKNKIAQIYSDSPDLELGFHPNGTYYNVDGPDFRDPATEHRLRQTVFQPALIGQTVWPEINLARQMAMAYQPLGMCVDNSSFPGAKPVTHADGVMHAVVKTAQAAVVLLNEAVKNTPDNFFEAAAHDAMRHSLHPSQVNFPLLKSQGRTKLAIILEQELASRSLT